MWSTMYETSQGFSLIREWLWVIRVGVIFSTLSPSPCRGSGLRLYRAGAGGYKYNLDAVCLRCAKSDASFYEDVWCWWADGEEWNEDGCGETVKCGKYLQRSAEAGWSEWRVNCWIIHDRCIHCNWQLETREKGAVSMCHQNCSYLGNMWTFNFFRKWKVHPYNNAMQTFN